MSGPYRLADGPMMPPLTNPRWRRLRRAGIGFGLLGVLGVALLVAHRPLLVGFANRFRADDPAPSDALVLLLGGTDHRPEKVVALYREHMAPCVLMANSKSRTILGLNETDESRKILLQGGVPSKSIHILPRVATSTRDEARFVHDYAREHPLRRITVVTTAFHTARARWIFRKELRGLGIDVRTAAARHPDYDESDWYTKDESLVTYFSEAIKTVFYRLVY